MPTHRAPRWTGHNGARKPTYPRLFGVVGLARETLHLEAPEIARSVDHVVIDGPPRVTALARSALLAADLVLIPVQPSPYDVWASCEMLDAGRRGTRLSADAAGGLRHQPARDPEPSSVARRARRWPINAFRALAPKIHQRIVFAESVAAGRLASELDP